MPESLTSIPLSDPQKFKNNDSVFSLVNTAVRQISDLFRAEINLAKREIFAEVRKGVSGSVFFIIALIILLYSSFFFFAFLAAVLAQWIPVWQSLLIVFIVMIVVAGISAGLGIFKVIRIRAPRKTIDSVRKAAEIKSQIQLKKTL